MRLPLARSVASEGQRAAAQTSQVAGSCANAWKALSRSRREAVVDRCVASTAASGRAAAGQTRTSTARSGLHARLLQANNVPVRPKPTAISSAIRNTPCASLGRARRRYSGSLNAHYRRHTARGSGINAQISPAWRSSSRSLRGALGALRGRLAGFALVGVGQRTNRPTAARTIPARYSGTSPTASAPRVSPW